MYGFLDYRSVEETGSLEAAAKKLHQIAVARAWEDDPEEAAYLAQTRQAYEDEEMENPQVYEDEDGYTYGYGQNAEEVVHLQEIVPGLWVGDLVAAMDTEGLKERGIVGDGRECMRLSLMSSRRPISCLCCDLLWSSRTPLPSTLSRLTTTPIPISCRICLRVWLGSTKL